MDAREKSAQPKLKSGFETDSAEVVSRDDVVLPEGYEIVSMLGEGGMGRVYKAFNATLGKEFAIKVLKAELSKDKSIAKRFQQEMEMASRLTNSNIVSILEHGIAGSGAPYLVMEYVEGRSLSRVIEEEGALDEKRALKIFLQICEALEYAHSMSIIHRDLKPSNIVLTGTEKHDEPVKIVDFGIAKLLSSETENQNLTQTGDVVGSPIYMSPEQGTGERLDQRSDIYSFGCVMYEALKGKPPFVGANPVKTILKHINEAPPSMQSAQISQDLEYVVHRCLEKNPAGRYQSVFELKRDLQSIYQGKALLQKQKLNVKHASLKRQTSVFLIAAVVPFLVWLLLFHHNENVQTKNSADKPTSQAADMKPVEIGSDLWYNRQGLAYFELGQMDKAIDCFTSAIKINPRNAQSFCYRARAHNRLNELQEAISDATQAISIDPNFPDSYIRRCWAYVGTGEYAKAIADSSKALELNPHSADAYSNRANAKIRLRDYQSAIDDCTEALRIDPALSKAYSNRAEAYLKSQRYQEAVDDSTRGITLDLKDLPLYTIRTSAYMGLGRYKEAVADATQAIELEPSALTYFNRGVAYQFLPDTDKALKDFEQALKIDPGYKAAYEHRFVIYESRGETELANAERKKLLDIELHPVPRPKVRYIAR